MKLGLCRAVNSAAPCMVLRIIWFSSFPALTVEKRDKVRERPHLTYCFVFPLPANIKLHFYFSSIFYHEV